MKKQLKQWTVFILVISLVLSLGAGPYSNANKNTAEAEQKQVEVEIEEVKDVTEEIEKIEEKIIKTDLLLVHTLIDLAGKETKLKETVITDIEIKTEISKRDYKLKEYEIEELKLEPIELTYAEYENDPDKYEVIDGENIIKLYYNQIEKLPEEIPEKEVEEELEEEKNEEPIIEKVEESPRPEENFEEEIIEEPIIIEEIIQYTDLIINHILIDDFGEEIGMTERVEGLEVGSKVYYEKYRIYEEEVNFIKSNFEELTLGLQGNVLDLYYEVSEDFKYTAESPDYSLKGGNENPSSYIKEFRKGELGPFENKNNSLLKTIKTINEESYPDEINNKNWPESGSLNLNKSGEIVEGKGNQWEITLGIEAIDLKKTTDIVLVIDRSGSMKGSGMISAKKAAKNFINNILKDETGDNVRIGIVSFSGAASLDSIFYGYEGKKSLLDSIDRIRPSGGTNIQSGIKQGTSLLDGSSADYKIMLVLGDGAATYSYQIKGAENFMDQWKITGSGKWFNPYRYHHRTNSNVSENNFNYNTIVGDGNSEVFLYNKTRKDRYYYRHGASTIAEANITKSKGYELFSISLAAGKEGEWTLKNIANGGKYYETYDEDALEKIFSEIAGRIIFAGREATVKDSIGDMYSIPGINQDNYKDLIKVSHGEISYDLANKKITWDIGSITEDESYWMKYKVALDYKATPGVLYPVNESSYVNYENIDNNSARKYFPIAKFKLKGLTLGKRVLNNRGSGEFDIVVEGPLGPYSKTWTVSLARGENKTIKGLLPGSYSVREIIPMNYCAENNYNLIIDENDWDIYLTLSSQVNNDRWFFSDDKVTNDFSINKDKKDKALAKEGKGRIRTFLESILPKKQSNRKIS